MFAIFSMLAVMDRMAPANADAVAALEVGFASPPVFEPPFWTLPLYILMIGVLAAGFIPLKLSHPAAPCAEDGRGKGQAKGSADPCSVVRGPYVLQVSNLPPLFFPCLASHSSPPTPAALALLSRRISQAAGLTCRSLSDHEKKDGVNIASESESIHPPFPPPFTPRSPLEAPPLRPPPLLAQLSTSRTPWRGIMAAL